TVHAHDGMPAVSLIVALAGETLRPIPHVPLTFGPLGPELILVGTALSLMILDALRPRLPHWTYAGTSLAGIAAAAGYAVSLWSWDGAPVVLGGMVAADR